jgi:O-antigen/teichoic acid export membrane protein
VTLSVKLPILRGDGGLRARFLSGAFWSVLAAVSSRGANVFGSVVVGRLLGRSGLGEYGMILGTLVIVTSIAGASLGQFGTRYVAEFKVSNPPRAGRVIGLTLLSALVLALAAAIAIYAFADALAARYLNAPAMAPLVRISASVLLFSIVAATMAACIAGLEEFRATARVNVLAAVSFVPVTLVLTHAIGLRGAIVALVVQNFVILLGSAMVLRRHCRLRGIVVSLAGTREDLAILWTFAVPAAMSAIAVTPVIWYGSVILVSSAAGYSQMGLFSAALQWYNAVIFIPIAISPLILSLMASSSREANTTHYGKVVRASLLANGAVAGCTSVGLLIAAPLLIRVYGNEFAGAVIVLRILALAATMNALAGVVGQIIASRASMWWGFALNLLWGTVFLTVAHLLVGNQGAIGLGLAYLISYSVHLVSSSVYLAGFQRVRSGRSIRIPA